MEQAKLNAEVNSYVKMLQAVRAMVDPNLEKFKSITAFEPTYLTVTDRLTLIEALQPIAVKKSNLTKKVKDARLLELSKAAEAVGKPITAYAGKINDLELKLLMDVKAYKLRRLVPNVLIATCTNIYNKAITLFVEAGPHGLTEFKTTSLNTKKATYATWVAKVGTAIDEINTSIKDIERLTKEAVAILTGQLDLMADQLEDTDMTTLELYRTARKRVNPPTVTTQQQLTMTEGDDKIPVENVLITMTGKKTFTATTNDKGVALFKPLPYGLYSVKGEAPGFETYFLKETKVVRGRVNKLAVKMVRGIPGLPVPPPPAPVAAAAPPDPAPPTPSDPDPVVEE